MRMNKAGRPLKISDIKEKVRLYRLAKLSYTEIGKVLGVSRQVVAYHAKNGKK